MEINYWAVLVSAIASIVIGSIWYGPLFGKQYMAAMGMTSWTKEDQEKMKNKMMLTYFAQFVASLVMFYVLAKFMNDSGQISAQGAVTVALWVWIGFVVPIKLGDALWGGKMILFWIGVGNMLVTLLVSSLVIARMY